MMDEHIQCNCGTRRGTGFEGRPSWPAHIRRPSTRADACTYYAQMHVMQRTCKHVHLPLPRWPPCNTKMASRHVVPHTVRSQMPRTLTRGVSRQPGFRLHDHHPGARCQRTPACVRMGSSAHRWDRLRERRAWSPSAATKLKTISSRNAAAGAQDGE